MDSVLSFFMPPTSLHSLETPLLGDFFLFLWETDSPWQPWLAWDSLDRPDWPPTRVVLCLPGIKNVYQHLQPAVLKLARDILVGQDVVNWDFP